MDRFIKAALASAILLLPTYALCAGTDANVGYQRQPSALRYLASRQTGISAIILAYLNSNQIVKVQQGDRSTL